MNTLKTAAVAASLVVGIVASAAAAPSFSTMGVAAAPDFATQIIVYDQPNFRGNTLAFDRPVPSLAALKFNDRVASLVIKGKRDWVLCENRNFMGRCVRVRAKANDLRALQIEGRVSSMYPVPVEQPAH